MRYRPCRQGRAALDRAGRAAAAAVRADEDRAGAGAGLVVPPRLVGADRQSAVPDPAADRGAGAGRSDREGAQSRHGGDHRAARRRDVLRRRRALVEVHPGGAAGAVRRAVRLWPPARLPARPHRHVPASRERSARRRLQHHPVEDRAGFGRHVGQGVPARHAGPSRLPAGEADRLHLHHDRRGVRLRGRRRA